MVTRFGQALEGAVDKQTAQIYIVLFHVLFATYLGRDY